MVSKWFQVSRQFPHGDVSLDNATAAAQNNVAAVLTDVVKTIYRQGLKSDFEKVFSWLVKKPLTLELRRKEQPGESTYQTACPLDSTGVL